MLEVIGSIGYFFIIVLIVILATALFIFINKVFTIYFFGFTGMFLLWWGCALVTGYIVIGLTEFMISSAVTIGSVFFQILRVIVVGAIWISVIGWIVSKFRKSKSDEGAEEDYE